MTRLILLRHAKSDWSRPDLPDHDRPLARRGRLAAPLMGAWLTEMGFVPDAALVSSSVRTRETWARLTATLPSAPEPILAPEIYEAEPDALLDAVRRAPAAETLLMLGHCPGLELLAARLARKPLRMPTAAAAVFERDGAAAGWADAARTYSADAPSGGGARLIAFESPKTLV